MALYCAEMQMHRQMYGVKLKNKLDLCENWDKYLSVGYKHCVSTKQVVLVDLYFKQWWKWFSGGKYNIWNVTYKEVVDVELF